MRGPAPGPVAMRSLGFVCLCCCVAYFGEHARIYEKTTMPIRKAKMMVPGGGVDFLSNV
ncbi:hypothetical protein BU16DRAFT_524980 [Lophium mytilinum]|uniref:Uncharacterized protein n=1 Tax=Lophium mytilinum TaxID=390894 RepID=A0A6A6R668_9PEZI|nr:hypothetical protein BU16DRAFT_524980 [Lophium mytilinum]